MHKEEIKNLLPYRKPYLMVDEFEVIEKEKKGIGRLNLTGNEYFFEGHFPERPVMPGVLIVEAIAQTAMLLVKKNNLKLSEIQKVKFRKVISPKNSLEIEVELNEKTSDGYKFTGKVSVDKEPAASSIIFLK